MMAKVGGIDGKAAQAIAASVRSRRPRLTAPAAAALACVLIVLSITAGVSIGAVTIPFATVWGIVAHRLWLMLAAWLPGIDMLAPAAKTAWSAGRESIVWDIRFPRAILAAEVGAGLALVGAVLQSATRNPLADPHLLGVSSGAALGAIVALLHTGLVIGAATVPIFAFAGALAATLLVMIVSKLTRSASADRLVLSGVAVSFIVAALGNLMIFLGDPRAVHTIVFWMLGGLGLAQWSQLVYPSTVLIAALAYLCIRGRELNALAMGDEFALSLGIPVAAFRMTLFVATALLTGVMVAFSGAIGFVGLMVPHVARLLVGSDNRRVLPLSAAIGAIALVWADIAARTIMAPEDMPIGIVTGLVGGVFFVAILRKR